MSLVVVIIDIEFVNVYYDELNWNEFLERFVWELGNEVLGYIFYFVSKIVVEKVFWKFRDEYKLVFKIVVVNFVYVVGLFVVVLELRDKIYGMIKLISDVYFGIELVKLGLFGVFFLYVDVRDVVRVILFGVENLEKVDGERFLLSGYYVFV